MKSEQIFDTTITIARGPVRISTIRINYDNADSIYETVSFHSNGSTFHGNWQNYRDAEMKHLEVIHEYYSGKWD